MTKVTFETDVLASALREVRGAVQRRNTIPILSNVLVAAKPNGSVVLTATDMDVLVSRSISAKIDRDVSFTVDANRLTDVVGTFANGSQTTIELTDGAAIVTSGRARTRFSTLPATDFPVVLQRQVDTRFTIAAKALTRGIGMVRHAVSTEETRYYLNGVFWHERDGKLVYVATDGHRLARYVDELPAGAEGMKDTILRTRCIDLARAAAEARDVDIEVAIGDDKVTMVAGDFTLIARVVEGTFPDYTRVIPTSFSGTLSIDRDELVEAVSRVTVAVNDRVRVVKIDIARDLVRTSVTSPEHGEAVDEVPCSYDGERLSIGFNGRYLREALGVLDVDTVDVLLRDATSPAIISSPKESGSTLVLMPFRV